MLLRNTSTRSIVLRDTGGTQYVVLANSDLTLSDSLWGDNEFRRWIRYRIRDLIVTSATAGDAISNAPSTTATNTIVPVGTGVVAVTVKQASGGSVNLQEWRNSANGIVTSIANDGTIFATGQVSLGGSTGLFLQRNAAAAGTQVFGSRVAADANDRFTFTAAGTLSWGAGSTAVDTGFFRSGTAGLTETTTNTIAGATNDISLHTVTPAVNGAFTLTRLNYLELTQFSGTSTVTDATVFRFPAAAGTHKAIDAGTTKTTPGTVNTWVKINVNGTVNYIPAYTSKTT